MNYSEFLNTLSSCFVTISDFLSFYNLTENDVNVTEDDVLHMNENAQHTLKTLSSEITKVLTNMTVITTSFHRGDLKLEDVRVRVNDLVHEVCKIHAPKATKEKVISEIVMVPFENNSVSF